APARHVLHRRPLPLRYDGRHRHRLPCRVALLVAEDVRAYVQRETSADRMRSGVHRLQRDVPDAVLARYARYAAALLQLPGSVPATARVFYVRLVDSRRWTLSDRGLSAGDVPQTDGCSYESMGWTYTRVGGAVAADYA